MFFFQGCEGIQLSEVTLDTILQASNGDMRKAVTFLQSAHQLSGGQARIPPEIVVDISGQVSPRRRDYFVLCCSSFITFNFPFLNTML
jgi:replication factor C subunit 2/4